MLSVIISTHDSAQALVPTLAALVPGAMAGLVREVIVADTGSQDDTAAVADMTGCQFLNSNAPLGERLKQAAAGARAPWLMFLRPGVVVDPGWVADVTRFINGRAPQGDDPCAAAFRAAYPLEETGSFVGGVLALWRARFAAARPDQGLVLSKRVYAAIGGHPDGPDAEAEIIRRIGRKRIVLLYSAVRSGS
jgi:glycosyltransferase involved in cell wall biosynthesis